MNSTHEVRVGSDGSGANGLKGYRNDKHGRYGTLGDANYLPSEFFKSGAGRPVILGGQLSEPLIIRVDSGARFHTDLSQYVGKYLMVRDEAGAEVARVQLWTVTPSIRRNTFIVKRGNGVPDDFCGFGGAETRGESLHFDFVSDLASYTSSVPIEVDEVDDGAEEDMEFFLEAALALRTEGSALNPGTRSFWVNGVQYQTFNNTVGIFHGDKAWEEISDHGLVKTIAFIVNSKEDNDFLCVPKYHSLVENWSGGSKDGTFRDVWLPYGPNVTVPDVFLPTHRNVYYAREISHIFFHPEGHLAGHMVFHNRFNAVPSRLRPRFAEGSDFPGHVGVLRDGVTAEVLAAFSFDGAYRIGDDQLSVRYVRADADEAEHIDWDAQMGKVLTLEIWDTNVSNLPWAP